MSRWGILLAVVAAAADVAGAYLIAGAPGRWDRMLLRYCLAVGAGFMLAAAFVRMLPESVESHPHAFLVVLIGYFAIHLFEHTVAPHFHFGEEVHADMLLRPSVGYLAVFGLGVHTFFDGVAIASGFVVGPSLGVLLFAAVLLHKLPEGFTVASVMIASGRSRTAALGAGAVLGGLTVLGALATALFVEYVGYALALSAGVTLYVAASDLIPEVNRAGSPRLAWAVFAGLVLFVIADIAVSRLGLH
jgi:zinc and cadmium transporter